MKQFLLRLLSICLLLTALNCRTTDVNTPDQPGSRCKLSQIDRGNGNKRTYAYDDAGYISKMTVDFLGTTGNEPKEVYVYTFAYDSNHQVTGATITVNGKKPTQLTDWGIGDAVSFSWTNGKLTQVRDQLAGKTLVTTLVSHDAQGRIVGLKGDTDPDWGAPFEKVLAYDPQGNFTVNYYDDGVLVYTDSVTIDASAKSAESLLADHGLPYDIFNIIPWRINATQEIKGYNIDKSGRATLASTGKTISLAKNSVGIATTQTFDENGKSRVMNFTLADCP